MSDELPQGWVSCSFMDVFDIQGGTQPPKSTFKFQPANGYVRLLQIRDFGEKPVPTYIQRKATLKTCFQDDVLIGRYGASVGRICTGMEGAYNVALAKVLIPEQFNRRFVFHLLKSPSFQRPILDIERSAQDGFNKEDLAEIMLPLAPFPEQQRIVAKLEKVLGHVDACKERLSKIPVLLKRFRQSVLAAACSGRLTADWREENPNEDAYNLIEKLAEARQHLWEGRELAKLKSNGKQAKPENWKRKYKLPFEPNDAMASAFPDTWKTVTPSQLAFLDIGFAFKSSEFTDTGIKLLRGENLEPSRLRWVDTKCLPEDKMEGLEHLLIEEGEIILALDRPIISSGLKIARATKADLPCVLVQRMMRFKMVEHTMAPWLHFNLQIPAFIRHLTEGLTGSDLPHVTGTGVAEYTFGLPPLAEQQEVVRRVEELFTLADQIEVRFVRANAYVEKLTQSVLAKAFRGELVPQDPNDEPASTLLERIKVEQSSAQSLKKTVRQKKS